MKYLFVALVALHGLINGLGFVEAFNIVNTDQLTIPISHVIGVFWLMAAILFLLAAIIFALGKSWWGFVMILAVLFSQILIISSWSDAKAGTILNFVFLIMSVMGIGSFFTQRQFDSSVRIAFEDNDGRITKKLTKGDTAHLPVPVQKYLAYTGSIGKPKTQNMYIEFDAEMYRKLGDTPIKSKSVQYNFFGTYSRSFLMKATKMGIPFTALHIYKKTHASFMVKVASLIKVVNISNEELAKAETVTLLNDMCIFAPGSLTDSRLSWQNMDSLSSKVTLTNGKYVVSAILYFNQAGELLKFVSDDRSALQDDGTMKQARWTTPVSNYKEIDGRKVPTVGKTIWNYPKGDFLYGAFKLKTIKYNIVK